MFTFFYNLYMKNKIFKFVAALSFVASGVFGLDIGALFPDVDEDIMDSIIQNEVRTHMTAQQRTYIKTNAPSMEVGYDLPFLSLIHQEALQGAKDQIVVDCGAGNGFFSAKLLAAGASRVLPIEMMKEPANNISKTIQSYEKALGKSFKRKYSVYEGDAMSQLESLGKKFKPTAFCFFNFFHYTTPLDALAILKKSHEIAAEGAMLYGISNAMAGNAWTLKAYNEGRSKNSLFAGYMIFDRLEHYEAYNPVSGKIYNTLEESQVVDAHSLDAKQSISPIHNWNGFYDPSKTYQVKTKSKMQPEYAEYPELSEGRNFSVRRKKISKSFFHIDMDSLKHLMNESGWELIEANYLHPAAPEEKIPDGDLSILSLGVPLNIIFKAIKKSTSKRAEEEL